MALLGSREDSGDRAAAAGEGRVLAGGSATAVTDREEGTLLRRSLDITVALVGLLVALPVLVVAAVAIRLDSPGPVLFRQERLGRHGRSFTLLKLRTMVVDNDESVHQAYVAASLNGEADRHGGLFKLADDSRITRVGRVLRRWSIDEVPQLLNVLRGEMSVVGPRPAIPRETELYQPHHWDRMHVKPGITGLWQVSGRSELSYAQMLELDLEYARTRTLGLDLRLLVRTPLVVLRKRGAA